MRLLSQNRRPTKHAPDTGDSAQISSSFLRFSIFPVGWRSTARPGAGNASRWAGQAEGTHGKLANDITK
jgi:hypothetical protein